LNTWRLKRMDNVGIVVDDLTATIDFFSELGLELEGPDHDWKENGPAVLLDSAISASKLPCCARRMATGGLSSPAFSPRLSWRITRTPRERSRPIWNDRLAIVSRSAVALDKVVSATVIAG